MHILTERWPYTCLQVAKSRDARISWDYATKPQLFVYSINALRRSCQMMQRLYIRYRISKESLLKRQWEQGIRPSTKDIRPCCQCHIRIFVPQNASFLLLLYILVLVASSVLKKISDDAWWRCSPLCYLWPFLTARRYCCARLTCNWNEWLLLILWMKIHRSNEAYEYFNKINRIKRINWPGNSRLFNYNIQTEQSRKLASKQTLRSIIMLCSHLSVAFIGMVKLPP